MRGTGAIGYPGAAEVVNMQPPDYLLKRGINALPCIGDGRQSGTSGSPSILNASPEAAVGGGLALLKDGDRIRVDLGKGTANILIDDAELAKRRRRRWPQTAAMTTRRTRRLAGNPARHRRSAWRRHGAEARRQLPAHRADQGHPAG